MGDCGCAPPSQSRARGRPPYPRMGVSSLQRPPMQFDRRLPLVSPIPPRPTSPPRMPHTVPGLFRGGRCASPDSLDRTLTPHNANRTLLATTRSPDFTKLGTTMEELSKLEFVEMQNIEEDLRDFHVKRRKLVFNIASINLSKAKKSIKKAVSRMGL